MTPVYCKVSIFIILISPVYCDYVVSQNSLESQLLSLLNKWREGEDFAIIPLPSLKSVNIPDVDYFYDKKGIKMTYILKKIELIGLDSFLIKELKALETKDTLRLSLSLNIPRLTLYADNYEIKGRAYYLYPLKGSGNMTIVFQDTDLTSKMNFITNGNSTRLEDFQFEFDIREIKADLKDSSWPINNVLNTEGVEILTGYHDDIVQAIWNYVVPYVDDNLENVTIAQIVDSLLNRNL